MKKVIVTTLTVFAFTIVVQAQTVPNTRSANEIIKEQTNFQKVNQQNFYFSSNLSLNKKGNKGISLRNNVITNNNFDSYVTLTGNQNIGGDKTFEGTTNFRSADFGIPNIPKSDPYFQPILRAGYSYEGTVIGYIGLGIDPTDQFAFIQAKGDNNGNKVLNLNPYGGHVTVGGQTDGDAPAMFNIRAQYSGAPFLDVRDIDDCLVRITNNGNMGLGTENPTFKLQVEGNFKVSTPNSYMLIDNVNSGENYYSASSLHSFQIGGIEKLRIANNGNIGIGTTSPDSKLTVKGKIHAEEIKVDLSVPGPDYVFEKQYQLAPLAEVQKYITVNKHLPEVPSAKEMEKNGINLSEMNMLLLKKVEELTLHLIEQDKLLRQQDERIKKLEKE